MNQQRNWACIFAAIVSGSFWICNAASASAILVMPSNAAAIQPHRPNILIITVDDMSCDSIGVFGCPLKQTTPAIDQFAKSSVRFSHAHVHVGNCMPSRNIMWSGLYSCKNGIEGFRQDSSVTYPTLCDLAQSAGYYSAIRGKVPHSTPYTPYAWDEDATVDVNGHKFHLKDPASYGKSVQQVMQSAKNQQKPFCLMVNISDPHKPFYGVNGKGQKVDDPYVPTKLFNVDTVHVPGFLHDSPAVRQEMVHYYNSVRRADDCFREVMAALDAGGQADHTFVMFLSDHGMPLPFAKTQLYHHSTKTPLMIRWPGITLPGSIDDQHMVAAVDFVPTLLDVMNHAHPHPASLQGRSFAPLLKGEKQDGRDHVILQYNENSGRKRHPMRGIHTTQYLYLYNAWSDGKNKFATATTGTETYRDMQRLAPTNKVIKQRLELFDHRVPQELFDIKSDPDCMQNLVASPSAQPVLNRLRKQLAARLAEIEDPMANLLADPGNEQLRKAFMDSQPTPPKKKKPSKNGIKTKQR